MSIFYDDKKNLASAWLLDYINKNYCYKYSSPIPEFNGYKATPVKIEDIAKQTKLYNSEILFESAELLFNNGHIEFEIKNHRIPSQSKIYILEDGRLAVKSSYYIKQTIKKWFKRSLIILGAIGTLIIIWVNAKKIFGSKTKETTEILTKQSNTKIHI